MFVLSAMSTMDTQQSSTLAEMQKLVPEIPWEIHMCITPFKN